MLNSKSSIKKPNIINSIILKSSIKNPNISSEVSKLKSFAWGSGEGETR